MRFRLLPSEKILLQNEINSSDLINLLEARKKKNINFILIDVREKSEYQTNRIVGVDYLVPTSEFYKKVKMLANRQEDIIIIQCQRLLVSLTLISSSLKEVKKFIGARN